jgi:ubiquinol-cytochrome c reductase cytochrome b subunit
MRYRPAVRPYFFIFILACLVLGFCGAHEPAEAVIPHVTTFTLGDYDLNTMVWLSRVAALYYFAYFLVITPVMGLTETPLPLPDSISEPVLSPAASAATQKG